MQPTSITLDSADLQSLNNFIQELPTKYGISLINFLNQVAEKNQEAGKVPAVDPDKVSE